MRIYESLSNYRVVVDIDDLLQLGQSVDSLIDNLKEASALVGSPLGAHKYTYDPDARVWNIYIDKEKIL